MAEVNQIAKTEDFEFARSILLDKEELVWALYDEISEYPDDFIISVSDLINSEVTGKEILTAKQMKKEYGITDKELARIGAICFKIATADICTCKFCGNQHERRFDRTWVSLAECI